MPRPGFHVRAQGYRRAMEDDVVPAWKGYLSVTIHRPTGNLPGHLFEVSRYGGVFSTTKELAAGERVTIGIDLDAAYERQYGAPDLLGFEAEITKGRMEDGDRHGEDNMFRFPPELVEHYAPWIETIAPAHGMRPLAGSRFARPQPATL